MIKISSKYNKDREYIHAGDAIEFTRVMGGIGWPGKKHGFLVVVGEYDNNRFVIAEAAAKTYRELLSDAIALQTRLSVTRWHTKYILGSQKYVDVFNSKQFKSGLPRLNAIDEPIESKGYVQENMELILDGVNVSNKTLHFFSESSLPAAIMQLKSSNPEGLLTIKIEDYPAVSALGHLIQYLDEYATVQEYVDRPNDPY